MKVFLFVLLGGKFSDALQNSFCWALIRFFRVFVLHIRVQYRFFAKVKKWLVSTNLHVINATFNKITRTGAIRALNAEYYIVTG